MPITTDHDYQRAISALGGGKLSPAVRMKLEANVAAYEAGQTNVGAAQLEQEAMVSSIGAPRARAAQAQPQGTARPSSYKPTHDPTSPSVLDLALDKLGIVDTAHTSRVRLGDSVSNMFGGNVQVMMEPSRSQFAEAAAKRGLDPAKLTDDDFAAYKDAVWSQEFDRAKSERRPVTRGSSLEGADAVLESIGENLVAGSAGALDALTFGTGSDAIAGLGDANAVDTIRGLPDSHRVANIGGTLVGALAPSGAPAKMSGLVSKALTGAEAGLARKIGAGAASGALVGALSAAGQDITRDAVDETLGREDTGPRADPLSGAIIGGVFGAGGSALGAGLSALRSGLRSGPMGPAINRLEAAGGKLGFWRPKVPEYLQGTIDEAAALNVHPRELAASKARGMVADEGTSVVASANARAQAQTTEAHKALEGQTVQAAPILDRFLDVVKNRRYAEDGSPLPMVELNRFSKEIPRLATARVVPAESAVNLQSAGARVVDFDEARALGFDVQRPGFSAGDPNDMGRRMVGQFPGGRRARMSVVLEPRNLTAPEVDELAAKADDLAGFKDSTEPRDPAWQGIAKAIKEARDEFVLGGEPGGYSALKRSQSGEAALLESKLANAGLPSNPKLFPQMQPGQQQALTATIRGYNDGTLGRLDKDRALQQLTAGNPAARAALENVADVGAARDVADAYVGTAPVYPSIAETGGMPRPRLSIAVSPNMRMRLDPAMERIDSSVSGGKLGARTAIATQPVARKRRTRLP